MKEILIGPPLATRELLHERLNKVRALAAFSPDALSSIAYANQEIYLGLVVAGSAGLALAWPIGIAITIVLAIVALSYFQTIHAYPSGGGSYIVARSNLGTLPGLVAASALLMDYILTAAVSLTAGVEAIASAFPVLWSYRVYLALTLLLLITLLNLRGLRETGTVLSIPVYLFLFTFLAMLLYGAIRWNFGAPFPPSSPAPPPLVPLTAILVLHAFSSGCTALTGIESISNGVPAFRPPEARNAGRTLIVMALLMGVLFLGSIGLTHFLGIVARPQETILSALARSILGTGPAYFLVQIATLLILTVAANTSFAGFPRVAAILAQDRFLPHQFKALGERLVFANGIASLAIVTGLLIVIFRADSHLLIPLFAVGAFLAFTLSQSGMVIHWWRERGRNWQLKTFLNGLGALATAITLLVVGVSKFLDGAWITILLIPLIVMVLLKIRSHYAEVAHELSVTGLPLPLRPGQMPRIVVPISGVHRGVISAMAYAQSISNDVTAVFVELNPGEADEIRRKWKRWWPDIPLVVVASPYRSLVRPLLDFLDQTDLEHDDGQLATVLLPEFVPVRWWHSLLHNQTAWMLKTALLYQRRRVGFQRAIIDVPFHLRR
ncbi:MAG TPA: APC family permease [Anaerolineales bacterium]|nr:APC family permease [Anaerolineales bacterium]